MRFRYEGQSPTEVTLQAWTFPNQPGDFIKVRQVFEPGEVTAELDPEGSFAKAIKDHPGFKPYEVPTIWERLLTDP